jgi:PTH1 family peptidyl-tRNA hydrolase
MKLVVGLGNPGKEYKLTRHNIGFMVAEELAERAASLKNISRFEAVVAEAQLGGEKVLLAKPLTFMNLSGRAVISIIRWYKIAQTDFIIVYDDMDLPMGSVRIRATGGSGGHNGMKSIVQYLGTQEFARIRLGIGRAESSSIPWVLGKFTSEELAEVEPAVKKAADAVECWCRHGITQTMNSYN